MEQESKPKNQKKLCLFGAISGDVIGSRYEAGTMKHENFELLGLENRFTDDTVMTLAIAQAILDGGNYAETVLNFGRLYPHAGYGGMFRGWLSRGDLKPYNSFGNGSAMRVSPVGWAFDSITEVLIEAEASAAITHNHPEGIKGAQAVALAVFLARTGVDKEAIRAEISQRFGYDLSAAVAAIRPGYSWDVTCQGSVPQALIAFFDSNSLEDAIRKAVSLGGDADTQAAIAGSVAEAYFGTAPQALVKQVRPYLTDHLWAVVEQFSARYAAVKS